jgi:23S rRNA (guanosine2251-2'-O)-methyltransferase
MTSPRFRGGGGAGFRRGRPADRSPSHDAPDAALGRVVIGLQPVREVLRARGGEVRELQVEAGGGPKLDGLERLATGKGVPVRRVSGRELDALARGGRHQGAIALAPELAVLAEEELLAAVDAWSEPTPPLVLVLDGIMDPQNFGAVVRSAVALGASFVVWPEHASAPLSAAMFRASAGAVEHARLVRVRALPDLLRELRSRAFAVVVLDARGTSPIGAVDLTAPVALVVGAEDRGSRGPVRKEATALAHLPMSGTIDSLNASVAAALALYEVSRQRSKQSSE